jgi:hypothetical protein
MMVVVMPRTVDERLLQASFHVTVCHDPRVVTYILQKKIIT